MKIGSIIRHLKIVLRLFCLLLLILGVAEIFLRFYYASNPARILYTRSYESGKGHALAAEIVAATLLTDKPEE